MGESNTFLLFEALRHFVWNLIGFQCAVAYRLVIPAEAGIQYRT